MLLGQTWRQEILEFYRAVRILQSRCSVDRSEQTRPRDEWNVTYIPSEIYGTMGNLLYYQGKNFDLGKNYY